MNTTGRRQLQRRPAYAARLAMTLGAALVWSACSDTPRGTSTGLQGGQQPPRPPAPRLQARELPTEREKLLEIARAIPGFAGVSDEAGELVLSMTVPSDPDHVASNTSVQSFLALNGLEGRPLKVRTVRNDYPTLYQAYRQVSSRVTSPDVSMLEISTSRNRVRIGVARAEAMDRVRNELLRLGVDTSLTDVVEFRPIVPLTTLQQPWYRGFDGRLYRAGGLQIQYSGSGGTTYICTNGFNAVALNLRGFFTASHCTRDRSAVDNGPYYQSQLIEGDVDYVGFEWADPAFFAGGSCPTGLQCRYSDAAFISYDDERYTARAKIAKPVSRGTSLPGSISINPADSVFTVTSTGTASGTVEKVGRTSGWTGGSLASSCADLTVYDDGFPTNTRLLCQGIVNAYAGPGDSGAPVFVITSGSNVKLVGILWGSSSSQFAFSRFNYIEAEFGPLQNVTPP